uniref:Rossmann fold nucleotide-binding protein Smf possibly involved in DNA uptake n=1 Tax=uncultured bacterium contig00015 TaxID=1181506 RepID=A0A806K2S5_9BACT|nr:Rossmann fold nucleotide-binding protein Smf possibly involved in DNA uptake [uncultured bacterium contig00015]
MNKRGLVDLIIAILPGLMPKERVLLIQNFSGEEDLIIQSKNDIEKILGREIKCIWDMDDIRLRAQRVEKVCRMRSIYWVSWNDSSYPPMLREMYDPPPVIFFRGCLPSPEKSLLGMVGTRRPSPEAAIQAYTIAEGAALAGISVVSGLALGIDAMSHRGNLCGGAPGYAVLGSGVDEIYPSSNRNLAKRILDSGGAILSEYPPGTRPSKWNFPARNRIISALSRSVIIVEAPKKSGSLITAAFALEQGRDLWVASCGLQERQYGSLHDKLGTIKLASDGADIIYSSRDVLERWNIDYADNSCDSEMSVEWDKCGKELASSMASLLDIEL